MTPLYVVKRNSLIVHIGYPHADSIRSLCGKNFESADVTAAPSAWGRRPCLPCTASAAPPSKAKENAI